MISSVSADSDPFGALQHPYKYSTSGPVLVPDTKTGRPGVAAFPEKRTLDVPQIKASSTTDRKKTNAQVCYTRVTEKHHQLCSGQPGGAVFVSRCFSQYDGTGVNRRSIIFGLDAVNLELSLSAKLYTADARSPLDDWRSVKTLREWTLDGVLLGIHKEVVENDTLNVCVQGQCIVTNIFDQENVFPMDTCFLCMVAELSNTGSDPHYTFKYVPCTSRSFADHDIHGTVLSRKKAQINDSLGKVVGAWKLGKVVDSTAVQGPTPKSIALCVSVEWVGWRVLKEQFPDCGIADTWINDAPFASSFNRWPCQVFNWPSFVPKDGKLEPPSIPERSKYELKLDKHVNEENNKRCKDAGPPLLVNTLNEEPFTKTTPAPSPLLPDPDPVPESKDPVARQPPQKTVDDVEPAAPASTFQSESREKKRRQANQDLAETAAFAAYDIIASTNKSYEDLIAFFTDNSNFTSDRSELEEWYFKLKSEITAFKIKYAKLVYAFETDASVQVYESISKLLRLAAALQDFQRQNSAQDTNKDAVIPF